MSAARRMQRAIDRATLSSATRKHLRHMKGCPMCRLFASGKTEAQCPMGAALFAAAKGT